jgi:hypothetical protein
MTSRRPRGDEGAEGHVHQLLGVDDALLAMASYLSQVPEATGVSGEMAAGAAQLCGAAHLVESAAR